MRGEEVLTKRERVVVGGILVVALVLRVAWCLYAARLPAGSLHDPNLYYLFGQQLANGNGYRLLDHTPTAYYPPGYAISLAAPFFAAYHSPFDHFRNVEVGVVAAMNILWQLLSIVLLFAITRRVTGRAVAGYAAAASFALWPNLVFHTAVALTESLFIFLLLGVVFLVIDAPWSAPRWESWRLVVVGLVLGAGTLVRPVTVPIFPLVVLVLILSKVGWRRAVTHTAVIAGAALLVLAPWAVRNTIVMHQLTLSTNTGDNLCMSRRVGGSGGFEFPNDRCFSGPFERLKRPEFETVRDAHGRALAIDFVKAHPAEELKLVVKRFGATFEDDADGLAAVESYGTDRFMSHHTRELLRTLATGYAIVAGLGGVVGLVLLLRNRTPANVFVVLTGVGMLIPPLVFFGDPRFHVPAVPIAAIGVSVLVSALADRRRA